jgi:pyrroline-5-carboxylate reductase
LKRLIVVGGGRMGSALVAGLLAGGRAEAAEVQIVEACAQTRAGLEERFPGVGVSESIPPAAGAVLAVKPQDAEAACRALAEARPLRVLSVVAGLRLVRLEEWLGGGTAVVRAMPNTPALLGAGASALAPGKAAGEDDLAWAEAILAAVGKVTRLPESLLDAVTGLSGSGPAYVFLVAEALIDAGVAVGLTAGVSRDLVVQTLLGAARMLAETGETPGALRDAVTSPGGTTAAGLSVLEAKGLRGALAEAVAAATARSKQLGE